jgi:hypothetical protein
LDKPTTDDSALHHSIVVRDAFIRAIAILAPARSAEFQHGTGETQTPPGMHALRSLQQDKLLLEFSTPIL